MSLHATTMNVMRISLMRNRCCNFLWSTDTSILEKFQATVVKATEISVVPWFFQQKETFICGKTTDFLLSTGKHIYCQTVMA